MNSATDESGSRRSGHNRLRIVLLVCFIAICLVVLYVLLSAPLLWYSVHHPGSSTAEMVEAYMQPLIWSYDFEATDGEYKEPLHAKVLDFYYGLWGSTVENRYLSLRLKRYLQSFSESMEEETPFLGEEGPDFEP